MNIWESIKNVFSPPPQTNAKPTSNMHAAMPTIVSSDKGSSEKKPELKPIAIRVSEGNEIKKHLQTEDCTTPYSIELFCPIRKARIFCHSILIDSLSDLTVFIISSLYSGHNICEISKLTLMGKTTMDEELQYLFESKLITSSEEPSLTDLGMQYGELLKQFRELSDGIPVSFNSFADIFEPEIDGVCIDPGNCFILHEQFVRELTRNDNYSNSRETAIEYIKKSEMPFREEIINSLYTTVRIENRDPDHGYKKLLLKDINKGHSSYSPHCFALAIPMERISYKARYEWVDKYRSIVPLMDQLSTFSSDLLSDEAKLVLQSIKEENDSLCIEVYVNMIDGHIYETQINLPESVDDKTVFMLDKRKLVPYLDPDMCRGIYLEEICKKTHYIIRYYSYQQTEVV